MADPAALQLQGSDYYDGALKVFFAWLPPKEFHRCRCLSRKWAAALSSDDAIDLHLRMRGKIRLGYDDLMMWLVLHCCVDEQAEIESGGEIIDDEKETGDNKNVALEKDNQEKEEEEEEEEEEGGNWREEYRTRGYVAVDGDYYVRRAEMQSLHAADWAKIDFSGISFADSDDEFLKAITVPYGALHPRIRQPFMEKEEEEEEDPSMDSLGDQGKTQGREKTEEEVDQEIISFLRRLRDMDPQPQFLRELDTYRWPWPVPQQAGQNMDFAEEDGQEDDLDHLEDDLIGD